MKKLMFAAVMMSAFAVVAADAAKPAEGELKKNEAPIFWGFGNLGVYSGYQLYGSLVNSEPTIQGYFEGNFNLNVKDIDLGYLGIGVWSNSDLTDKRGKQHYRTNSMGWLYYSGTELGKMCNEWDFNVHWGKTFWFDDNKEWGLDYRTSVVWYYYPHRRHNGIYGSFKTTMDWNHSFQLLNPYVIPFIDVVHEYHESDGNLLQFGLKKPFAINDNLEIVPSVTMVWRNSHYGWCFPYYGTERVSGGDWSARRQANGCFATLKIGFDATYMFTENIGLFAKAYFCTTIDDDLREAAGDAWGSVYGKYKDFAWGGVGVTFKF